MPATEPRHPIGVVSERTGLSPDVLRVWERRYSVVKPERSPGGQRLYSDADIERLTLLHRATQGGHGISHVASLSTPRLESLVPRTESPQLRPLQSSSRETDAVVDEAVTFAEKMDPAALESLLRRNVASLGIVHFLDSVVAPLLRRIGDGWHSGRISVSQEHFATAVVERVVSEASQLLAGGEGNPVIVIATLEGERHAVGALMAAATAASEGWKVIYLGADVPANEIAETAGRVRANAVAISIVLAERRTRLLAGLRDVEAALPPGAALIVGGAGSKSLRQALGRSGIILIDSLADLRARLGAMRPGSKQS